MFCSYDASDGRCWRGNFYGGMILKSGSAEPESDLNLNSRPLTGGIVAAPMIRLAVSVAVRALEIVPSHGKEGFRNGFWGQRGLNTLCSTRRFMLRQQRYSQQFEKWTSCDFMNTKDWRRLPNSIFQTRPQHPACA